jgi:hypothetical protein
MDLLISIRYIITQNMIQERGIFGSFSALLRWVFILWRFKIATTKTPCGGGVHFWSGALALGCKIQQARTLARFWLFWLSMVWGVAAAVLGHVLYLHAPRCVVTRTAAGCKKLFTVRIASGRLNPYEKD